MPDETASRPPAILPDPDTAPFWSAAREYRLDVQSCAACDRLVFPPKPFCPRCLGALRWKTLRGEGRVESFTIARVNVVNGYRAPYVVAWVSPVEQDDIRFTCNIVECPPEAVSIGMKVEIVFEDRPGGETVPQFRPLRSGGESAT